jgi:hypothetical protein
MELSFQWCALATHMCDMNCMLQCVVGWCMRASCLSTARWPHMLVCQFRLHALLHDRVMCSGATTVRTLYCSAARGAHAACFIETCMSFTHIATWMRIALTHAGNAWLHMHVLEHCACVVLGTGSGTLAYMLTLPRMFFFLGCLRPSCTSLERHSSFTHVRTVHTKPCTAFFQRWCSELDLAKRATCPTRCGCGLVRRRESASTRHGTTTTSQW